MRQNKQQACNLTCSEILACREVNCAAGIEVVLHGCDPSQVVGQCFSAILLAQNICCSSRCKNLFSVPLYWCCPTSAGGTDLQVDNLAQLFLVAVTKDAKYGARQGLTSLPLG